MLANQLALKYAQAIFELASEKNKVAEAQEQLIMVETTIAGHEELAKLIYHPRIPAPVKGETLSKVFSQELTDFVHKFLLLLVNKRRESLLPAIVQEFQNFVNQANQVIEAEVTTALPLLEEEQQALADKLKMATRKNVLIKVQLNPAILGGVIVKIGDKLIDGSVARQLQVLKTSLLDSGAKIGVTNQV